MKKITLLLLLCIASFGYAQTTMLSITHINGETPADFKATLDGGNLVEGSTLAITVNYTNVQPHPNWGCTCIRVRLLNNYGLIPEFVNVDETVTTSTSEQTVVVNIVVPDVSDDVSPGPIRIQAIARDETGGANEFAYASETFSLKDLTTLSSGSLEKNKLSAFYNASKDVISIGDTTVTGDYNIFDLAGKSILKGEVSKEINVETLKSGMYILATDKGSLKFVK
ncbi:hypothetical protein GCM10022291_05320 [Postechiella marina]|uniref:Uncharacterized protein n=1 Tax=Postechiella marina TaxID=943941 RepID=A0ABP8C177_9FLAO